MTSSNLSKRCAAHRLASNSCFGETPIVLMTVDEQRIICPYCRSNWGHGLKPEVLERLQTDHAPARDGQCADMVAKGVAEPYYAPGETPWLSGSVIQYPRPNGYGGLHQLRKEAS